MSAAPSRPLRAVLREDERVRPATFAAMAGLLVVALGAALPIGTSFADGWLQVAA